MSSDSLSTGRVAVAEAAAEVAAGSGESLDVAEEATDIQIPEQDGLLEPIPTASDPVETPQASSTAPNETPADSAASPEPASSPTTDKPEPVSELSESFACTGLDSADQTEQPASPPPAHAPRASARDEAIRAELESSVFKIKTITWYDPYGQTRESPIILQNKNGPCPLIALVNTLILSTPPDVKTPISNISASRTEISAKYLIDLLADVLLSSENTEHTDVNNVLSLLPSLHTGLNINPRFDGSFESSEELALFRAFDVDLVHGWVSDPANKYVDSAVTKAGSYEGAQGYLVQASEFTSKLDDGISLTDEEMALMETARLIDLFLSQTATQLTSFGLKFLSELLSPGSLAVLFRNDHFSTVYKHPDSKQLFMLVTDSGFSHIKNIVWESLNDVSGSSSYFFNGVFVPSEFGEDKPKPTDPPPPPASKQVQFSTPVDSTDLDLALAMELQQQEDEQVAREQQLIEDRAASRGTRSRQGSSAAAGQPPAGSRPHPGTRGSHGNARPRGPNNSSGNTPSSTSTSSAGTNAALSKKSKRAAGGKASGEKDKCCIM
ncbi:hypothetical protein BZA70DRAFT_283629 [Myxozyma melibiosi]|uniref:MINDY deubiquitinase domain-containing protein n=1 Tax=Myxozyma melibiosi TaxID=54550 RepID=A0ABR1F0N1_9ASCO